MADEQLYGIEGIEHDQGYVPMPEPAPDKDPELERAEALTRFSDNRDQEAAAKPIIQREYVQEGDKPQPENRTVELDRAAADLAQNREAEAAIAEIERDLQLANEIDAARKLGQGESRLAQEAHQPEAQQQPEQQPAQTYNDGLDGVDPEVAAAFRNPKVLSVLTDHYSAAQAQVAAAQTQAEAQASAAVAQAAQWAQQNAEFAAAAVLAHPALQGISAAQLPGAIQALTTANPQAAAQIRQQLTQVQALTQQAHEAQRAQQHRQAAQFHEWGKASDDAFERSMANEPPETVKAIRQTAMTMMREAGLTDQQLAHEWNTNALLRSVQGQSLLADAARWRMAKAGIKPAPKPVPQVARPGSSMDRPDASDRDSFALENRFPKELNVKQAAELIRGRRARAR